MDWDAVTGVVAVLALGLSVIALFWNARLSRDQRKLAKAQLEAHERGQESKKRADIVAHMTRERLYLINQGGSIASDVNIDLRSKSTGVSPFPDNLDALPIESLESDQEFPLLVAMTMGCGPPFEARITWKDPDGEYREKRMTLGT